VVVTEKYLGVEGLIILVSEGLILNTLATRANTYIQI